MRLFRAMVNTQVATVAPLDGSNRWALCHKVAITSCAHSSASCRRRILTSDQERLYTRREMQEQLGKSRLVLRVSDAPDMVHPLGSWCRNCRFVPFTCLPLMRFFARQG